MTEVLLSRSEISKTPPTQLGKLLDREVKEAGIVTPRIRVTEEGWTIFDKGEE